MSTEPWTKINLSCFYLANGNNHVKVEISQLPLNIKHVCSCCLNPPNTTFTVSCMKRTQNHSWSKSPQTRHRTHSGSLQQPHGAWLMHAAHLAGGCVAFLMHRQAAKCQTAGACQDPNISSVCVHTVLWSQAITIQSLNTFFFYIQQNNSSIRKPLALAYYNIHW